MGKRKYARANPESLSFFDRLDQLKQQGWISDSLASRLLIRDRQPYEFTVEDFTSGADEVRRLAQSDQLLKAFYAYRTLLTTFLENPPQNFSHYSAAREILDNAEKALTSAILRAKH